MDEGIRKKIMTKESKIINDLKKNTYFEEKLSKYSWFNSGGAAEIFFRPNKIEELSLFLKKVKNKDKINIIGAGSNTLIRDGGVEGVTIKLSSKFSHIRLLENNIIEAGAATLDKKISDFATKNSLTGFEFLSCIPGSVGGGIKMNTGCYNQEISQILVSVQVMDENGNLREIKKEEINFSYRKSNLSDSLIILSAKFKGMLAKKEEIQKRQLDFLKKKKLSQPSRVKTCGSTFKNTEDRKAWSLIKESNCQNMAVGGAKISEKHCNFFINNGKASSSDIEELLYKVKNQVLEKTGVSLELEIKIIGNN
tara:strand:+ start:1711 stop:2637 length:927 start_codon:yes stop_codon:yes gene_type:complete